MTPELETALHRVYHDLCVLERDRTDGDDLAALETAGLMWSRELTDDDDAYYDTLGPGDTVYEWTRKGNQEIRKIEAARAALEGKPC
jgi:hypothetical protein